MCIRDSRCRGHCLDQVHPCRDGHPDVRSLVSRGAARVTSPIVAALTLALSVVGCSAAGGAPANGPTRHTVVVLAASSLTESLTAIAKDFEATHPGTDVQLSFASSSN